MRIAYCTPGLGPSGGARVILDHVTRLAARGHEVTVFLPSAGDDIDWYGDFENEFSIVARARISKADRYDVAVATGHDTVYWTHQVVADRYFWFMQMREELFHKPNSLRRQQDERAYAKARELGYRIITIAQWLADHLKAETGLDDIPIVRNGVDERQFYRVPVPTEEPYILLEGDARNGAKDIEQIGAQAAFKVRERYGVHLVGCAATVPPWAKALDNFVFRPTVADYRRLYTNCLFMLKASRYEGRSLAPLEAMACGQATCRAIVQGDDDLIDGENCLRVGYDVHELTKAAYRMCEDYNLLVDLHMGASKYAQEYLRWEPIIKHLEALYAAS